MRISGLSLALALGALLVIGLVFWGPSLLRRYGRWLTNDFILRVELTVIALLVLILALLMGQGTRASFVASVTTEALTVEIQPSDPRVRWPVPDKIVGIGADLPAGCDSPGFRFGQAGPAKIMARFSALSPKLIRSAVPSPQEEAMVRLAEEHPGTGLRIVLDGDRASVGALLCADGRELPAPARVRLEYNAAPGEGVPTLPVAGLFTIGGAAANSAETDPKRATPILLSGVLSVEAESWPFRSGRSRAEAPLQMGDVVTFETGKAQVPATGLVRSDHGALAVVAYADAERALVARRNLTSIPVAYGPTLWARIQAMNEWNALILFGGLALAIVAAVRRYLEAREQSLGDVQASEAKSE